MSKLPNISPKDAHAKLQDGALLVDIRSLDEHARKHITDATPLPLSDIDSAAVHLEDAKVVIFHCLSGMRTEQNAQRLAQLIPHAQGYLLAGGMQAWEKAGLPITVNAAVGLDLMRQVQIVAGLLILLGVGLGALVSPWFYGLAAFVGAGLMFAGITGFCGMARLLAIMPWNRIQA